MRMLAVFALAAAFASTQISNDKKAAEEPSPYLSAEGYEVYADLLPTDWTWTGADLLVIQKETQRTESAACAPMKGKESSGPWAEALADYDEQNASAHILSAIIPIGKNYVLKSADEIKAAFKTPANPPVPKAPNPKWGAGSGWEGFFAAFPQATGYIILSAPGFSQDGSKAVVYMGHHCGNLCGGGRIYFLGKEWQNWKVGRWRKRRPARDGVLGLVCPST